MHHVSKSGLLGTSQSKLKPQAVARALLGDGFHVGGGAVACSSQRVFESRWTRCMRGVDFVESGEEMRSEGSKISTQRLYLLRSGELQMVHPSIVEMPFFKNVMINA